jgi:hypothetical protein
MRGGQATPPTREVGLEGQNNGVQGRGGEAPHKR